MACSDFDPWTTELRRRQQREEDPFLPNIQTPWGCCQCKAMHSDKVLVCPCGHECCIHKPPTRFERPFPL